MILIMNHYLGMYKREIEKPYSLETIVFAAVTLSRKSQHPILWVG